VRAQEIYRVEEARAGGGSAQRWREAKKWSARSGSRRRRRRLATASTMRAGAVYLPGSTSASHS
jgi:hypothetical protein